MKIKFHIIPIFSSQVKKSIDPLFSDAMIVFSLYIYIRQNTEKNVSGCENIK